MTLHTGASRWIGVRWNRPGTNPLRGPLQVSTEPRTLVVFVWSENSRRPEV